MLVVLGGGVVLVVVGVEEDVLASTVRNTYPEKRLIVPPVPAGKLT